MSGFVPNREESIWSPSYSLKWLGFIWDLRKCVLQIPESKILDLQECIGIALSNPCKVKIRTLAKICGKVISLTPAIGNVTQIMTRATFAVINERDDWDQCMDINFNSDLIFEFMFWKNNVQLLMPVSLLPKANEVSIFSDASDVGAGGFIQNSTHVMYKSWTNLEKVKSSTWREVKAIELCLVSFAQLVCNSCVVVYTDNQNAVSVIEKGSKILELQNLTLSIFNTCIVNCISINVKWIPREENEKADYLSRIVDIDDWGTSDEFFEFVDNLWGPHSIDRFANMENRKLLRFNSLYWNPGSESMDSFTCNWHEENNWLVPPVALAAKVINHLVKCRAVGTLIVPKWSSSPFWPLLFEEGLHYKPYVEDVFEFLEANRIFVAGHNVNSTFAQGDFKGTVLAVRLNALDM
ncbi:uncharacterized protein LOC134697676 [Mytilus trossulus]|uniref:uncharacterized protein LOC134697676 n=1 Tax=Mytilus trossulus TaxID=6551 RepID=UPI00300488D2